MRTPVPNGLHISPGMCISDRYDIICVLGRGRSTVVYLARDRKASQLVALKAISPEISTKNGAMTVLMLGYTTAKTVEHKNIVRVCEINEWQKIAFITMAYIPGGTLSHLLAERGGRLTLEETMRILRQIAPALDFAHGADGNAAVHHLALKPANILLDSKNRIKIADFGIARRLGDLNERIYGTLDYGSLCYRAPEQIHHRQIRINRNAPEQIGAWTDIYALGAIAYELLSGRPVFTGSDIKARILSDNIQPIEDIPRTANRAIESALAKNPLHRPMTATDFTAMLAGEKPLYSFKQTNERQASRIEKQETKKKKSIPPQKPANAKSSRSRLVNRAGLALTLLIAVGVSIFFFRNTLDTPTRIPRTTHSTPEPIPIPEPKPTGSREPDTIQAPLENNAITLKSLSPVVKDKAPDPQSDIGEWVATNYKATDFGIPLSMQPEQPGRITLHSKPEGATVFLDKNKVGTTPLVFEEQPLGLHAIALEMAGYDRWQQTIEIKADTSSIIHVDLIPATGMIRLESSPENAQVYLDGRNVGETPLRLSTVKKGKRRLMLQKKGYRMYEKAVIVATGSRTDILAELKPENSHLEITSLPTNAEVYISGEKWGTTPLSLTWTAGEEIEIKLMKHCFKAVWKKVTVAPGTAIGLPFILEPDCGRLVVDSSPDGADWFLDDSHMGKTPGEAAQLPAGPHTVRFEKSAYHTQTRNVEIPAGETERISASLSANLPTQGELSKDPITQMPFVWIETDCSDTRHGATDTTCPGGFWIGQTEVTQGQWFKVMGTNPAFFGRGRRYPVDSVSWNDAQRFIRKLNELNAGRNIYRLPTEEEWSHVCRRGKTDDMTSNDIWHIKNSSRTSHPVGKKGANDLSIFDMRGNLNEWVSDSSSQNSASHIIKGGSWRQPANQCACDERLAEDANHKQNDLGFRLVKSLRRTD